MIFILQAKEHTFYRDPDANAGEARAPFLGLLEVATRIAEELVLLAEHLARAELAQARGHARVLLDVDREVQEALVPRRDRLARQAPRLARQHAFEQPVHYRGVVRGGLRGRRGRRGLCGERRNGCAHFAWGQRLSFAIRGTHDGVLTVLSRFACSVCTLFELPPVRLHLLHDLVQQKVEELVGVLMLRAAEELVEFLELVDERAGGDDSLVGGISADV